MLKEKIYMKLKIEMQLVKNIQTKILILSLILKASLKMSVNR